MQRRQPTGIQQFLKGRRLSLLAALGIEELAVHAGGGVADQLQGKGFDAGGMEAVEHMDGAHQRLIQLQAYT